MYPVFQYSIIQYIIFYLFLTLTATSIILLFFMMLQLPYTLLLNKNKSTLESGFDSEFFPVFLYTKTFSSTKDKFNNFLIRIAKNIIVQGAERLIITSLFIQCYFQNFLCSILCPNYDRYPAAPFLEIYLLRHYSQTTLHLSNALNIPLGRL